MRAVVTSLVSGVVLACIVVISGTLYLKANAQPVAVPVAVSDAAKVLHCETVEMARVPGPENRGEWCAYNGKRGYQDFIVTRYVDPALGRDFLKWWVADPTNYFAQRGHIFVLAMGDGGDSRQYNREWTAWAAKRLGGHLRHG